MRSAPTQPLLLLSLLLLALGGGWAWWTLQPDPAGTHSGSVALPGPESPAGVDSSQEPVVLVESGPGRDDLSPAATNVLWPLEVELELQRAAYLPMPPDRRPIGADRSARLVGQLFDANGEGIRGEVRFVAGPNQGRTLVGDAQGRFGATDLYPGLDIVEVHGPSIQGSRRELLLRQGSESQLNIGYGRPAAMYGTVVDKDAQPIEGAEVLVDNQRGFSDSSGVFYIGGIAAGEALIEVSKPGYAALRQKLNLAVGATVPVGRLTFVLKQPARLQILVVDSVGAPVQTQVYLLPSNQRTQRDFPWYSLNPVLCSAGIPKFVEGLPPGVVSVRAFHPGARASQAQNVNLRAGQDHVVQIKLEPAPALLGRVLLDGQPQYGARVRLEAVDRVNATLGYFRETSDFLESEVMPQFPLAVQECLTDADGRFQLTAWADVSPTRYIEAVSADGRFFARRLVGPKDLEFDLKLEPADLGRARLVLELPGRFQGLPVEVSINGQPQAAFVLRPERELEIEGLLEGVWRLRASWRGEELFEQGDLELEGFTRQRVELPAPALEGQDAEAWRRAGR